MEIKICILDSFEVGNGTSFRGKRYRAEIIEDGRKVWRNVANTRLEIFSKVAVELDSILVP